MTADLSALIARREAAEAGSRDLDGAIHRIFLPDDLIMTDAGSVGPVKRPTKREAIRDVPHIPDKVIAEMLRVPDWTTSLDAALALAERVLPGWVSLITAGGDLKQTADLFGPVIEMGEDFEGAEVEIRDEAHGEADTPALALVIAVLKAKQGEE